MKEIKLSDVKVGDLLWEVSNWTGRNYPKVVTKVTNSMVFSKGYKLPAGINCPEAVERAAKILGLKNVTTHGDMYNGGASVPISGNEHCFDFYPESKEKKTYKRRGVVRDNIGLLLDPAKASLDFDFYLN
jgi:hypothetical protein